jgi:pyrroline-5-carboxylate reductase
MSATPSSSLQVSGSIAFIGGGNMARSLIGALIRGGLAADSMAVAEPNPDLRTALARDFGVTTHTHARDAAEGAGLIVIAVKPQVLKSVCAELTDIVAKTLPMIISIAAGIRVGQLREWLGSELPIVRAMPNTPALVGAGATGLIGNEAANTQAHRAQAEAILGAAGTTVWIEREELMDIVTALSGSGPAYFFLLVEALEDAAVAQGLPRATARALAKQTCLGAGRMLVEDGEPPTVLRERVTSPGGTTAAALDAFASGGLRDVVASAIDAATRRGRELSEKYS